MILERELCYWPGIGLALSLFSIHLVLVGWHSRVKSDDFLNYRMSILNLTNKQFMISRRCSISLLQRHSTRVFARFSRESSWRSTSIPARYVGKHESTISGRSRQTLRLR